MKLNEPKWEINEFSQLRQSYLLQTMIMSPTWCLMIIPFTVVNNKFWDEPKLTITRIKAVQVVKCKCKPLINYIKLVSHSEHKSTIRAIFELPKLTYSKQSCYFSQKTTKVQHYDKYCKCSQNPKEENKYQYVVKAATRAVQIWMQVAS